MFNKVSHVLLSLVLFISTTGLTIDKHYCGDNLVSVSLFGDAKSCCDMDGGCCHQETDSYILTVDYTNPVFNLSFDQDTDELPAQATVYTALLLPGFSNIDQSGLSPPLSQRKILSALQNYRL
jgi:hypothetical protein